MKIKEIGIKQQFYKSLNERQKRQYAAQLAIDLGHGGIKAVSKGLGIGVKTISKGIQELNCGDELAQGQVRKKGGGRKKS